MYVGVKLKKSKGLFAQLLLFFFNVKTIESMAISCAAMLNRLTSSLDTGCLSLGLVSYLMTFLWRFPAKMSLILKCVCYYSSLLLWLTSLFFLCRGKLVGGDRKWAFASGPQWAG